MCKKNANVCYIRVSSTDQNTGRQFDGELESFDRVFEDHCSGKNADRPGLRECLSFLREGDVLHVFSIDRLARNLIDLERIISDLIGRGCSVQFRKENMTFTADDSNPMNTLLRQILGSFAQFERSMIRERQREGIDRAKNEGRYAGANHKGRRSVTTDAELEEIRNRIAAGEKVSSIARELGISRQALHKKLRG